METKQWATVLISLIIFMSLIAGLLPTFSTAGNQFSKQTQCEKSGFYYNSTSSDCRVGSVGGTVTTSYAYNSGLSDLFTSSNGLLTLILLGGVILIVFFKIRSQGRI